MVVGLQLLGFGVHLGWAGWASKHHKAIIGFGLTDSKNGFIFRTPEAVICTSDPKIIPNICSSRPTIGYTVFPLGSGLTAQIFKART